MKITLESKVPGETVVLNMPSHAEIWRGHTEGGIAIVAYVMVLTAQRDEDTAKLRDEFTKRG